MTREEAIERMKTMRWEHATNPCPDRTAFDMAISALSEQKSLKERMEKLYLEESLKEDLENLMNENERLKNALSENKGEWIIDDMDSEILTRIWACHCSICGKDPQEDISGTENWWLNKLPNFCPNCGADIREPKGIIHKAIDNTTFAEEAYPNIKEELHKAVDMAESKGEKGTE